MRQSFPKPSKSFERNIYLKADLSNYAKKTYIKDISHIDTSSFSLKSNLVNLKTEADKRDIDKLVPLAVDLKWRNFDFISIVRLQNLIDRISVPPIQKQPFADFLQNSCF